MIGMLRLFGWVGEWFIGEGRFACCIHIIEDIGHAS